MKAIGWAGKTMEQVSVKREPYFLPCFPFDFFLIGIGEQHVPERDVFEMYILYFKHYEESGICLQQQ